MRSDVAVIQSPPARGDELPILIFDNGGEVTVAAGDETTLVFRLDPRGEANGELEFGIVLEYQSRDGEIKNETATLNILMEKPFDIVKWLLLLVIMLLVFFALQAAVIWPACRYVARVRGLPVSTRVVSGDILINNVDQIKGFDKKFDDLIADHRNLGKRNHLGSCQSEPEWSVGGLIPRERCTTCAVEPQSRPERSSTLRIAGGGGSR